MSAVVVSAILTVALFFAAIYCSRRIGGDDEGGDASFGCFDIWGLILDGVWDIFRGIRRGEFNYKFECGVLVAFVISLAIFLVLLTIEFLL